MSAQKESFAFGAETGKILQLMIHSLYAHKDIFLRELVSNASDACDKCRYALQTGEIQGTDGERLRILIACDEDKNVVSVEDNGVGMNREELIANLGVIAKSGTQNFIEALKDAKDGTAELSLIGRFGVGFYSSFMVADKVEALTRKAGEDKAWRWTSEGGDRYEIEEASLEEAPARGTRVTLYLRPEDAEYASEFRIRHIVRTYSDHVPYPVELSVAREPLEGMPKKSGAPETVNEGSALWTKKPQEIEPAQYNEFYRHVAHAGDDPWLILHGSAEGAVSYRYLLFIPSEKPFDLFNPDRLTRVRLYVKRVFIADEKAELIPAHLRFARGVIDSEDLPLNISRETLQHNAALRKIRKAVTNKILGELQKKMESDRPEYEKFWQRFGAVLKEGLCESVDADKEKLLGLCLFRSTQSDGYVSLKEYKERMKEGRSEIFYLIGEHEESVARSPQLEGFRKADAEVLLMTDPVDDFWVNTVHEYQGTELVSAARAGIDLASAASGEESAPSEREQTEAKEVCAYFKQVLGGRVLDVRVSGKLSDTPVCLAVQEGGMDMRLERFLVSQKQLPKASPKVLEINPKHAVIRGVAAAEKGEWTEEQVLILFDQARIAEGESPEDPYAFGKRIFKLLEKAQEAA